MPREPMLSKASANATSGAAWASSTTAAPWTGSAAQTGSATETGSRHTFPWLPAIVFSTLLFLAENHRPEVVIDGDENTFVTNMQGNILRQFCYISLALLGIYYLVRATGYRVVWRTPLAIAWGLLTGWCILSAGWAQEPTVSLKRIFVYLLMVVSAAGVSATWSRKTMLQFISLSGAAHLTAGILAEIATGYFTPWVGGYRFAGTEPWNVQGFCCLLFILASVAAADADPKHKAAFRAIALYGFTFLVLTKSRSSLAGIAAGYVVYLLLTQSFLTKIWVGLAAGISALLLLMTGIADPLIGFLTRSGEGAENLTGRQPLWELALTFVKLRPMTGYGYQNFWTTRNVDYFFYELHWPASSAHNSYLDNVLTLGYVGLVLHVSILVFGIVRGSMLYRKTHASIYAAAAAICAVFLVVGTLEAVIVISPGPYAFGVTMLIWALCLHKTSDDPELSPSTSESLKLKRGIDFPAQLAPAEIHFRH